VRCCRASNWSPIVAPVTRPKSMPSALPMRASSLPRRAPPLPVPMAAPVALPTTGPVWVRVAHPSRITENNATSTIQAVAFRMSTPRLVLLYSRSAGGQRAVEAFILIFTLLHIIAPLTVSFDDHDTEGILASTISSALEFRDTDTLGRS
jgi:hypothetical protein